MDCKSELAHGNDEAMIREREFIRYPKSMALLYRSNGRHVLQQRDRIPQIVPLRFLEILKIFAVIHLPDRTRATGVCDNKKCFVCAQTTPN
jgi:hypothetical protein